MTNTSCVLICVCVFTLHSLQTVLCRSGGDVNSLSKLDVTQTTDNRTNLKVDDVGEHSEASSPELLSSTSTSTTVARFATETKTENHDFVPEFPDPLECGFINETQRNYEVIQPIVVGGTDTPLGLYPWMALLGYNTRRGRQWGCGGSLISVRHVLTAAHCIYNREHILKVVRLGELDYNREDEGAQPIDYQIKKMIVHEDYNPNNASNDIAILVLDQDVKFTNLIHPICMPKGRLRTVTFEGSTAFIAGWGFTAHRGTAASHLQGTILPVHDNSVCVDAFKDYTGRIVDERVMCAGYRDGSKDSCNGDSGGPLMHTLDWDHDESYKIVTGVVSYGLQCGYFGVYTRVTYYLPWIEKKVLGRLTN